MSLWDILQLTFAMMTISVGMRSVGSFIDAWDRSEIIVSFLSAVVCLFAGIWLVVRVMT